MRGALRGREEHRTDRRRISRAAVTGPPQNMCPRPHASSNPGALYGQISIVADSFVRIFIIFLDAFSFIDLEPCCKHSPPHSPCPPRQGPIWQNLTPGPGFDKRELRKRDRQEKREEKQGGNHDTERHRWRSAMDQSSPSVLVKSNFAPAISRRAPTPPKGTGVIQSTSSIFRVSSTVVRLFRLLYSFTFLPLPPSLPFFLIGIYSTSHLVLSLCTDKTFGRINSLAQHHKNICVRSSSCCYPPLSLLECPSLHPCPPTLPLPRRHQKRQEKKSNALRRKHARSTLRLHALPERAALDKGRGENRGANIQDEVESLHSSSLGTGSFNRLRRHRTPHIEAKHEVPYPNAQKASSRKQRDISAAVGPKVGIPPRPTPLPLPPPSPSVFIHGHPRAGLPGGDQTHSSLIAEAASSRWSGPSRGCSSTAGRYGCRLASPPCLPPPEASGEARNPPVSVAPAAGREPCSASGFP